MNTNMTYTTEQERLRTLLMRFTKEIEKDYNGITTKVLRGAYQHMYNILKELPVEKRMYEIDTYTYKVQAPASVPMELRREEFIAGILTDLMRAIFTFTYADLKEDLLEAMKSIE